MIEKERIKYLNNNTINSNGKFVVYWMQSSQRVEYNQALEYAIRRANELDKPLIVYFGLTNSYPDANIRHYEFMIEGLKEVSERLKERKIQFIIENISPEIGATKIAKQAVLIVTDRGYLRHERNWRNYVSCNINIPLVQVETNVIVPIEEVSNKEEYSASTIRKKINKQVDYYAKELKTETINNGSNIIESNNDLSLNNIMIDKTIKKSKYFTGGPTEAKKHLDEFVKNKLDEYDKYHSDPSLDYQSNLSMYLHFGQISPLYVYNQIKDKKNNEKFLEELIVRRELAFNFVYYNNNYDSYDCLPKWAKSTFDKHKDDIRDYIYDKNILENYLTHDIYWNAAQKEMVITGKMHGYMRMYWGKKIIEWTNNPEEAFNIMVYLNNKYNIDGRDPNSYAGIAWCFGKHDRPWKEREVFGIVRYMNAFGLERKFNMKKYLNNINKLK